VKVKVSTATPCGTCGTMVGALSAGRCNLCRELMCPVHIRLVALPEVMLCRTCIITEDNASSWWDTSIPSEKVGSTPIYTGSETRRDSETT
jgi:hypothetical protein